MELTTMSVVCPFPPSFGIAKMASNLKNPHFIKDKSTSKSGFMSGLQHAVYNINPEETVITWQFSEFYILLSASMLIRKSGIHTCVWGRTSHALPLFVPSYDTLSLCFNSRACLGGPNSICECSVRRRRNLTLVSNVSEAAPISACSGPPTDSRNYRNAFLKFSFNLIRKSTMAFLTGQSWRALKSGYTCGGPEQGFRCCFGDDGLNQS